MATVLKLNDSEASNLLDSLSEKCSRNEVTDFVIMARTKDGNTVRHWFGNESSLRCLGMVSYLVHVISSYIDSE